MTPEQGQAVATKMKARYVECSAKEQKGVNEVFELAIDTAVKMEEASYETKASPGTGARKVKKPKKSRCKLL